MKKLTTILSFLCCVNENINSYLQEMGAFLSNAKNAMRNADL